MSAADKAAVKAALYLHLAARLKIDGSTTVREAGRSVLRQTGLDFGPPVISRYIKAAGWTKSTVRIPGETLFEAPD